eukprot:3941751-Rhodomonas_salina.2
MPLLARSSGRTIPDVRTSYYGTVAFEDMDRRTIRYASSGHGAKEDRARDQRTCESSCSALPSPCLPAPYALSVPQIARPRSRPKLSRVVQNEAPCALAVPHSARCSNTLAQYCKASCESVGRFATSVTPHRLPIARACIICDLTTKHCPDSADRRTPSPYRTLLSERVVPYAIRVPHIAERTRSTIAGGLLLHTAPSENSHLNAVLGYGAYLIAVELALDAMRCYAVC